MKPDQQKISPSESEDLPGLMPDPTTPKSYRIRRGEPNAPEPDASRLVLPDLRNERLFPVLARRGGPGERPFARVGWAGMDDVIG
jgi:hypothetical protein